MKKVLCVTLVLVMLAALCACKSNDVADITTEASSEVQTQTFIKPDSYAIVLLVTINPQIRLYLDSGGIVLAVEAVNEDAIEITENISLENKNYEAAIEAIVTKSEEKGYIKEDAQINVSVAEKNDPSVNTVEILDKVTVTVEQTATKLKLKVEIKTEDNTIPSEEQETATTQATEKPTDAPTEPSKSTESEDPAIQPTQCSHTYKDASCTAPKTCSKCGATEGTAAGHTWKDATCTAPKTCVKCSVTEGKAAGHTLTPTCSKCGNINSSFVNLLSGKWQIIWQKDSVLNRLIITFDQGGKCDYQYAIFDPIEKIAEEKGATVEVIRNDAIAGQYAYYEIIDGKEYIGEPCVIMATLSYTETETSLDIIFDWDMGLGRKTSKLTRTDWTEYTTVEGDGMFPAGATLKFVG